jgi:hypothetical protein
MVQKTLLSSLHPEDGDSKVIKLSEHQRLGKKTIKNFIVGTAQV